MYREYWLQINNRGYIGPYSNISRVYKIYRQLVNTTTILAAKIYSGYGMPEQLEHVIV